MNPYALIAIIVLAIAASAQYFLGTRKNRFLTSRMSGALEELLKPSNTNYVNIGGSIGYNFAYSLTGDWTKAKGTMTLNARHSLLYLPFSLLLGVRDRFFMNIFTKRKLRGEAHLVEASYLRRANIDGVDSMDRLEAEAGGKRFVMLWRGADLSGELKAVLESLGQPERLRHFCAYPETKTFFVHLRPKEGNIRDDVSAVFKAMPSFFEKREA